jgi:hypothetical protein
MPEEKPPLFPEDPHFWFEMLRVIAADEYGGSQVGEALAVAARIKSSDYDSWHAAWNAMADRVAGDQLRRGHKVSARDGYLPDAVTKGRALRCVGGVGAPAARASPAVFRRVGSRLGIERG